MRIINTLTFTPATITPATITPATITPNTLVNAVAINTSDDPRIAATTLALRAATLALRAAEAVGEEQALEEAVSLLRDTEEQALEEVGWRPISDLKIVENAVRIAQLGGSWDHARRLAGRALELSDGRRINGHENPLDRAHRAHARALVVACDWESQVKWLTGCELPHLDRFDYSAGEFPAAAGGIIGRYESDYWPQTVEYLVARDEVPLFGDPAGWMLLYVQQQ